MYRAACICNAGPVRNYPNYPKTGGSAVAMGINSNICIRQRVITDGGTTDTFVIVSMDARFAALAKDTAIRGKCER